MCEQQIRPSLFCKDYYEAVHTIYVYLKVFDAKVDHPELTLVLGVKNIIQHTCE